MQRTDSTPCRSTPDLGPSDPAQPAASPDRTRPRGYDRVQPGVIVAIAAGGALGTLARAGLGRLVADQPGRFPWTTLSINLTGSFVLGLALVVLIGRPSSERRIRPFLATGFLGSYTTFSTFAVGVALLIEDRHWATASLYLVAMILGGVLSAWLGIAVGRRIESRTQS